MLESVRDGLWRPGGAFFQIGLGCVMSHHQSPHRRALHIPVLILAGKFKMEFLPTVSHWKGFPVAQICPNLQKIVSSSAPGICRALLCDDDSSYSQSQSGKRLLLAFRGHPARTPAYQGSCIDPTHLSHTLNLILKAPGASCPIAIGLLKKDERQKYFFF